MQSVLNSVKGTALGVAEYLTPVLKVIHLWFQVYSYDLQRKTSNLQISKISHLICR